MYVLLQQQSIVDIITMGTSIQNETQSMILLITNKAFINTLSMLTVFTDLGNPY